MRTFKEITRYFRFASPHQRFSPKSTSFTGKIRYLGKLQTCAKTPIESFFHKRLKQKVNSSKLPYQVNGTSFYINIVNVLRSIISHNMREFAVKPPESVKGMTKLDKSLFKTTTKVPALKIPVSKIHILMKKLKNYLLKFQKIRHIVQLSDNDDDKMTHKLCLIDPTKIDIKDGKFVFPDDVGDILSAADIEISCVHYVDVDISFDNFTTSDILDAVLPDDRTMSAFEAIGHIAHLNIKEDVLDYKYLIGEVILEKTSFIRTVVNKVNTIDNTYRNFAMELIAGVAEYETTHRENGCVFAMDYSRVYWNSRLSTEHQRLVDQFEEDAVVYDVFAGIGPFSIPAAKRGCRVVANDLNPESFKWLQKNISLNKVHNNVVAFNMDGNDFIKDKIKSELLTRWKSDDGDNSLAIHVIMNLPAIAIEFLTSFCGLLESDISDLKVDDLPENFLPTIHCYCFTVSDTEEVVRVDISERLSKAMGGLPKKFVCRFVRHVAPNKDMYCVSFRLKHSVLVAKLSHSQEVTDGCEPDSKRQKCDDSVANSDPEGNMR